MPRVHDIIRVTALLKSETDRAYLVDGGFGEVWVPKSLCIYEDGELELPGWLAVEKKLIP